MPQEDETTPEMELETVEVDPDLVDDAVESAGTAVGEVSDDDIAQILDAAEIDEADQTREVDVRAIRGSQS